MRRHLLAIPALCLLAGFGYGSPVFAAKRCTGVPTKGCMLPFPNDFALTRHDASSATGRRVAFTRAEMPANSAGVHIDPTEWNRNDGFSPGDPIVVHVSSLRNQAAFRRSRIVPVNDLAQYTAARQPLLLLDEATGRRQIVWGELDASPASAASRYLIIHPAKNLTPGHRYVVVLRNLRDHTPRACGRPPRRSCAPRCARRRSSAPACI